MPIIDPAGLGDAPVRGKVPTGLTGMVPGTESPLSSPESRLL